MRMTKEEALDELNVIYERLSHPEDCEQGVYSFRDGDYLEALDMALELLEKEPCEDCVSREAVKEQFEEVVHNNGSATEFLVRLWKLPLVQPTRPTGKWKELEKITSSNELICECSVCGHVVSFLNDYPKSNYCPKCGARMGVDDNAE